MRKRIVSLLLVLCIAASLLPMSVVQAADGVSAMTVTLAGCSKVDIPVSASVPVRTVVVNNGVASVKTGEANGWLVRMEYNDGSPKMTLRNASTTEISAKSSNTAPLHIVLEGENSHASATAISANGKEMTFSGSGSLNITNVGTGIGTGVETVTINGATINVSTSWFGVNVKNLLVYSGALSVTTSRDDKYAVNASGSITVKGGTLEAKATYGAVSIAPDFSQYSGCAAVGGISSTFASEYDAAIALLYKYIKIMSNTGSGSGGTQEGIKPFYAVAWDAIDESLTPNINECVFLSLKIINGNVYINKDSLGDKATDLDAIAAYLKMEMACRPEGMRFLCIPGIDQVLSLAPEAIVYLDAGVDKLKTQFTLLMQKYYALGGKLDGLVIDLEYTPPLAWYIYAQGYGGAGNNKNIYNDIVNHPKYQTEIRPYLEDRGFQFYTNVGGEKSEIWNIAYKQAATNSVNQTIWDVVTRMRISQYMNEALFEPMSQYYPNAIMSDYQATDTYGWLKGLADDAGRPIYTGGNSMKAGNASNLNFYACRPGENYFISESTGKPVYNNPPAYNKAVYEKDAFNMCLWDMKKAKDMLAATDTGLVNLWVSAYDLVYPADRADTYAKTPYYSEMVLHFGLLNPQPFLFYLSKGEYKENGAVNEEKYNAGVKVMSQLLDELTRMVGAEDRQPIDFPYSWNDGYLLTGMTAGGKNVWRITPDTTDGMTLEAFRVADATYPTFSINGKTVTFPQGTVVETAEINIIGSCGYWVVTPANVLPVVKADADRFEENPAYIEDFESYAAGTAYTGDTALPAATWSVTLNGTATVQENTGNKALAVSGAFVLANQQLPQNVTAGDSYAKHQTHSLTVTLPSGLNTAADLKLLTANADGGIRIFGGEVYYPRSGSYVKLSGVDLSAGGTYVLKRTFDFSVSGAYTCDYAVYNADGSLVGSVADVPLTNVSAPITAVSMTGSNVAKTVLLDDYKLYITGFAGDFEVYDANAGVQVDVAALRSGDTAYRYSWANAGDKVKNVSVVASFYDSNNALLSQKTVKTLRLVPGNDGVETGIVEVPAGQKVRLSVSYGGDTDPIPEDFEYAEAVQITRQPENAIVAKGETAKVTFAAQGEGLTYRWYFREKGETKFTLTKSFTGNTYSVKMDDTRAGRQVCCIVTDRYGNSVQTAIVTIGMKVTVTKQPVNVTVANGETAKVTFTATGEDLTYRWYFRNKGVKEFTLTKSFTGNTYSVKMDDTRAGRQVCCIVTDRYGNFVQTAIVTIDRKVAVTKQPVNSIVKNGETAKVTFTATGEGLTYKWYFKNKGDSKFSLTTTFKGNTYTAPMNSARAGRQVYCVITDKYGNSVKTNTVTLGMKVSVAKQPVNSIVVNGATAKVSFTATGEGLTYKWYFKNKGDSKFSLTTTFKGNTYTAPMNSTRAGRQVYCVITDKYGNSVKTNTVTLGMKVSVAKQPVSVTVANGATAKVTFTATGEGLTYKWYFKNKGDTKFTLTTTFTGNTYTAPMNSARAGRQVYCVITDKYGNTVQTNTVTIKMK